MTILYLNDKQCAIPADFSFTLKKTSLFWNEETDHTFDLDLDLSSSDNRIIFGHIDRYNVNKQIPDMTAKLLVNNRMVLVGDVYLLSIDGDIIKIQIVGEGTSFSYKSEDTELTEGAKMLYELSLGTIQDSTLTHEDAYNSFWGCYPEKKYVCLPTKLEYGRRARLNSNMATSVWEGYANCVSPDNLQSWSEVQPLIGHPYLLFLLERVCFSLGYVIRNNDLLKDEQACREVIITAFTSLNLVDHVPSWTVAKFFREIEKHFNAMCLFNKISKTVDIYTFRNEIESGNITYLEQVLDKPDIKFEEEKNIGDIERNFSNVCYNLPSTYAFYKEADLSDEVLEQCIIKEVASLDEVAEYNSKVISRYNGVDFIRRHEEDAEGVSGHLYEFVVPLNLFQHKGKDENVMELNIVPCLYTIGHAVFCTTPSGEYIRQAYKVPVVVPCNKVEMDESSSADQTMDDLLNNGVQESKRNVAEQLFIGVYNGIQKQTFKITDYSHFFEYPEIAVPLMVDRPDALNYTTGQQLYRKEQRYGLMLEGKNSLSEHYYTSELLLQDQYHYNIKFVTNGIIEPGQFVLRNKRMFCSSIEYTITKQGVEAIAEGEFYEIKI